jgi:hypothetical protein
MRGQSHFMQQLGAHARSLLKQTAQQPGEAQSGLREALRSLAGARWNDLRTMADTQRGQYQQSTHATEAGAADGGLSAAAFATPEGDISLDFIAGTNRRDWMAPMSALLDIVSQVASQPALSVAAGTAAVPPPGRPLSLASLWHADKGFIDPDALAAAVQASLPALVMGPFCPAPTAPMWAVRIANVASWLAAVDLHRYRTERDHVFNGGQVRSAQADCIVSPSPPDGSVWEAEPTGQAMEPATRSDHAETAENVIASPNNHFLAFAVDAPIAPLNESRMQIGVEAATAATAASVAVHLAASRATDQPAALQAVDGDGESTEAGSATMAGQRGSPSLTLFHVLGYGYYEGQPVTKLLVRLVTGRRHQIRLHLHYCGYPILGDNAYSDCCTTFLHTRIPRMMLHSWRIRLDFPSLSHCNSHEFRFGSTLASYMRKHSRQTPSKKDEIPAQVEVRNDGDSAMDRADNDSSFIKRRRLGSLSVIASSQIADASTVRNVVVPAGLMVSLSPEEKERRERVDTQRAILQEKKDRMLECMTHVVLVNSPDPFVPGAEHMDRLILSDWKISV